VHDEQAIANLVFTYAARLDAGDIAGVAELFAAGTFRGVQPDGTVHVATGAPEVARYLRMVRIYDDGTPRTKHVTTNLHIEVDPEHATANCRSYFSVLQAVPPDFPPQVIIAGRYEDRFAHDGDRWRFVDRLIYSDLFGDLTRHLKLDPFSKR
jgi:hypothetical protein